MKEGTTILNIAAGKIDPLDIDNIKKYFLVNLDTMYYSTTSPDSIESMYDHWSDESSLVPLNDRISVKCKEDAFQFMERTSIQFDIITCYRFLEHVKRTDVLYFIYLLSTSLKIGGIADIIVPDYEILATMILSEVPEGSGFDAHDIILTTELLNEPSSPHCSIWTKKRFKYFFHLEDRFEVDRLTTPFEFDGRNIYLRCHVRRVK